jgi:hypothetical protein
MELDECLQRLHEALAAYREEDHETTPIGAVSEDDTRRGRDALERVAECAEALDEWWARVQREHQA